jgi:hypothetical protein
MGRPDKSYLACCRSWWCSHSHKHSLKCKTLSNCFQHHLRQLLCNNRRFHQQKNMQQS